MKFIVSGLLIFVLGLAGGIFGKKYLVDSAPDSRKVSETVPIVPSLSDRAIEMLGKVEEVGKIRTVIEKAGNKLFFMSEGESNGEVTVVMSENLSDHTSRIATFYVHIPTRVITVDDVVQNERISLEEWKKQVRESWEF